MTPFIVLGLPRSRTFWLSRYLSYGEWTCEHEQARYVRNMDDARSWLSLDYVGSCETSVALFWRLIRHIRPETKIVLVRRDIEAVMRSLTATGIPFDNAIIRRNLAGLDRKLNQIGRSVPDALSVRFDDLNDEATCARVFEFCLGQPHDHEWWARFAPVNLQMNLRALVRFEAAHAKQFAAAKAIMKRETIGLLWRSRAVRPSGEVTIQEEPWDSFWRDGQELFKEHAVLVGESPDSPVQKNVDLGEKLAKAGYLHIMTARSNGRMFGYLVSAIGPSLESETVRVANQTTFYASPEIRGLGMKLQRASIRSLLSRGGPWEIFPRAGVRGSGPRLGALYRRMGAEEFGQLYKLSLNGAASWA